jgi:hypothetical protein
MKMLIDRDISKGALPQEGEYQFIDFFKAQSRKNGKQRCAAQNLCRAEFDMSDILEIAQDAPQGELMLERSGKSTSDGSIQQGGNSNANDQITLQTA